MAENNNTSPGGGESAICSVIFKVQFDDSSIDDELDKSANKTGGLFGSILSANLLSSAISAGMSMLGELWNNFKDGAEEAYQVALEAEMKLENAAKNRFNMSEKEINNLKKLAEEYGSVGLVGETATLASISKLSLYAQEAETLEKLIPTMQDATVGMFGFNYSTEDAAEIGKKFGEALKGNAGGLEELGIYCSEAEAAVFALGTEQEKVEILTRKVAENMGGLNSALANTDYGKQIQLNNAMLELKETMGEFLTIMKGNFVDVMIDVVEWLNKAADAAVGFAKSLGDFLVEVGFKEKTEEIKDTNDTLQSTENVLEEIKEVENELAGFDQFNLFGGSDSDLLNSDEVDTISKEIDLMDEELEESEKAFANFFETLKDSRGWNSLKDSVMEFKNEQLPGLAGAWQGLKTTVSDTWDYFAKEVLNQEDLSFLDFVIEYVDYCKDYLIEALTLIIQYVDYCVGYLGEALNMIAEGLMGWAEVINNIGEKGIFENPTEDFQGFSLFGVPLIETVESAENRGAWPKETSSSEAASNITFSPTITIGGDQILDYTIEGINAKSAIKGHSVIN